MLFMLSGRSLRVGAYLYILFILTLIGGVMGSFITCFSWRHIHGESVLKGRSHCDHCGAVLGPAELVPVFSYLCQRGKCRHCGTVIAPDSTIAEGILMLLFPLIYMRFGFTILTLRTMLLAVVLMGISLIDLKTYEIPDGLQAVGILIYILSLVLMGWEGIGVRLLSGLTAAAVPAGVMLVLSLVMDKVLGKESLGGGDIKLFFMTGLYLTPWEALFNVILACFMGLFSAVILRRERIPFGPSIAAAGMLSILFGGLWVSWYLGLF